MIEPAVARRIRLVGVDVDGTMTDGGLYIGVVGGQPTELKRFHIHDGIGVQLMRAAGLPVAVVTGRGGQAAEVRARELMVDEFIADSSARKLPAFEGILQRRGVRWEECAFIGDDLADLPIMRRVALPVAVANAVQDVKASARHTLQLAGGHGAVREFAEQLLQARGVWAEVVRAYLRERGDVLAR